MSMTTLGFPAVLMALFALVVPLCAQDAHLEHHLDDILELLERGDLEGALAAGADLHGHEGDGAVIGRFEALCSRLCRLRGFDREADEWILAGTESVLGARSVQARIRADAIRELAGLTSDAVRRAELLQLSHRLAEGEETTGRLRVSPAPRRPVSGQDPITLGTGRHSYTWVRDWAKLPEGMKFGNTHGSMVVDREGLVYINTDTEHAVMVFKADGTFVRSFGKDLAGGLHGMALVREGDVDVLWVAHHGQNRALALTLKGEVIRELPSPMESKHYEKLSEYHPTSVAVSADGTVFVADGYGKSWIHRYSSKGVFESTFGGRGKAPGQFQTPHGLWMDPTGKDSRLLVADRENHRLQWISQDGKSASVLEGNLRRPCNVAFDGKDFAVADLAGRVTILDSEGNLVCHLGDQPDESKRAQNGIPSSEWKDGEFISPHSVCFDAEGNLYVMDWLALGRITKLARKR